MNPLPFSDLDDEGFLLTLYEFQNGSISYNQDRLGTLFFNPLLLNTRHHLALNSNLDPDENFLGELINTPCEYKACFPLGGILRVERNFSLSFLISSTREITRQRKIPLRAQNSA